MAFLLFIIITMMLIEPKIDFQRGGRRETSFLRPAFYHSDVKTYTMYSRYALNIIMPSEVKYTDKALGADFVLKEACNVGTTGNVGTTTTDNAYRLVCALDAPAITILAPDDSHIRDLSDIATCDVQILVPGTDIQALSDVLAGLGLRARVKVINDEEDALSQYPDSPVYFEMSLGTSKTIQKLTQKCPSHIVTMRGLNKGNYFVTAKEASFYRAHPYYKKYLHDGQQLTKFYPYLSQALTPLRIDTFVPSLKSPLLLLAHKDVPELVVQKVLKEVLRLIHKGKLQLTVMDINNGVGRAGRIRPHRGTEHLHRVLNLQRVFDRP